MDGKGRDWITFLLKRRWCSVKHEWLYMHEFQTVPELYAGLNEYFEFYNTEWPHQSLSYKTPQAIHFA
ncbi:MAG: transposase [Gammaproteobacteria bacterium]|nr:transposase [Gammaproteobacteria bacterium]